MASVESLVQAGDWRGLGRWLGFESRPVRISAGGLAGWNLGVLEGHSVTVMTSVGARLVVVAGGPSHRSRRVAMREVHRRNPLDVTLWMWVSEEVLEVTFGVERSDGGFDVRRMVLARDCPELEGLRQLEGLRISGLVSPDERERGRAVRRHFEETLDRETITRSFFSGFRQALNLLDQTLLQGPLDPEQRHAVCLNTLLRVLFLYFLQSRSALNNDRRFILRAWRGRDREGSFYRSVLRPLFFGALNTPLDQRDEHITRLGDVPFLNGGLFDPTPVEQNHPALDWPDETWCHVLENLMERYHFEVGDDDPSHNCSIDPEMLGKVFEGLMFGDARAKSGSFYTPVDVVRSMVRQGLESHLCQSLGWSPEKAGQLWVSTTVDLDTRDQLRQALTNFRVLDPAAGTGAFLLETLHHLKHLWTLVDGQVDHVRLRTLGA
ncbi:MAG: type IIL restriction-modification enzyme MmeI [bacterium]